MSDTLSHEATAGRATPRCTVGDAEPFELGSDARKRLFSRMLLATDHLHKPAVIEWSHLEEDEKRMSGYDAPLPRPIFVPRMARFARRLLSR
ncbi:hypothetical protein WKR88_24410 [Trinickia caryophylli]|uniref:Uncharacterized protein n=1 Tax=Trinickia caryophylli TaxID=28094 RepID=A0A1X7E869_TRICW|nr:hypothetical protein [Trinickia caryophylli]TRX14814.1 hypothetical protein FNF07_26640 [Trinickia caryophylli]WQE14663.1 hypothetical protein U0034_28830 [Trinickia caryophylli]GLU31917.1 hypothetical protein Busp01_17590 [Trinickia caryophylli]SMF29084.1 hypothetical protein SAMN06295900_10532 [Trinickia caryophylli]